MTPLPRRVTEVDHALRGSPSSRAYARTIRATSGWRTTSASPSSTIADVLDAGQKASRVAQPAARAARQIDLRHVAVDDHLRTRAQARKKHLELFARRVLRFVEDHEGVGERAAAHVRERRDLDRAALEILSRRRCRRAVRRARRRAAADTDRPSLCRSPGKKPSFSPASTAGRDSTMRETSRFFSARTAMTIARNVLPVPAGPMPNVSVLRRRSRRRTRAGRPSSGRTSLPRGAKQRGGRRASAPVARVARPRGPRRRA